MYPSMRTCLLLNSFLLSCLLPIKVTAQQYFPTIAGEKVRYVSMIEMPKAYVSGFCILYNDSTEIQGSFFNEFGVSAIDFSYIVKKDKVRLHHVMGMMNKWYIRKILKKDLRCLIKNLQNNISSYNNEKFRIKYNMTPINSEENEITE